LAGNEIFEKIKQITIHKEHENVCKSKEYCTFATSKRKQGATAQRSNLAEIQTLSKIQTVRKDIKIKK
jgi:hypothetical protein